MAAVNFYQVTSYPLNPVANALYFLKRSGNKADLRLTDSAATYYDIATDSKVLNTVITGLSIVNGSIISTDTILEALGKAQGRSNAISATLTSTLASLNSHLADTNNPHAVTKAQVGLGSAENTSDANKPVSTAQQAALNLKVDKVAGKGLSTNDYDNTEKAKVTASKTKTDLISITQAVDLDDIESKANSALQTISGIAAGGELSGTYANPAVLNSAVLAKVLTGLNVAGSTIASTDTLLEAFGKLQSQLNSVLGGAIYQSTWNASTNSPTLSDGTGTKGHYYVVSVAGTRNLGSGNIDFQVGDWAIHNGTIYQKVDNTDAVSSVNGFTGAVNLTSADITEVTNLYFTNARAIGVVLTGYVSGAGTVAATDTILQAIQKLNGNISAIVSATNANIAGVLHAATADTSPLDADEVTGLDSANSFGLIRTTWTTIKAFLKTYFDTQYPAGSGTSTGTNTGNETTTTIGSLINGATDKATPVDADYIGIMDSAASNILKKLSWANIKATLKTYFDSQYTYNNIADFTIEPAVDQTAQGPRTNDLNAGATISIIDLVILDSSSKWQKTDANTQSLYQGMIAMSLANGTNNNPMNVALPGCVVRNDAWNWTPGKTLYMSETAGGITDADPSTFSADACIRVIGFALTDDCIYFNPSPDFITHI